MKLILIVLNIAMLSGIACYWWKREKFLREIFWPALSVKLLAGITVGWVYTFYYTVGDTFNYFHDGALLADLAKKDLNTFINFLFSTNEEDSAVLTTLTLQEPRAVFFTKIVSVFNFITLDNYWIMTLYFSFFSFVGTWFLVRTISQHIPETKVPACIAFLFYPSVVFWSSGLIKESLAVAALFFLTAIFVKIWFDERVKLQFWLLTVLSAWVLWNLKYYFAAVFFPIVITTVFYKFISRRLLKTQRFPAHLLLWLSLFLIPLSLVSFLHPNFYPEKFLHVIIENYTTYSLVSAPEDFIHFNSLTATGWSVLINAPWALVSGLFRPFIFEAGNIFQLLISLENLFLLLLCVLAFYRIRSTVKTEHRMLIFIVMIYIGILCVFLTLSTPNFGTLSRYKVGYLPYVAFLIFSANRVPERMKKLFSRLYQ